MDEKTIYSEAAIDRAAEALYQRHPYTFMPVWKAKAGGWGGGSDPRKAVLAAIRALNAS